MQANEFEKNVQQKMDELQLTPSAQVWAEVEKRIRREKKRRRIIFWWLLFLLLAGGGAGIYFTGQKNSRSPISVQQQKHHTAVKNEIPAEQHNKPAPDAGSLSATNTVADKEKTSFSKNQPEPEKIVSENIAKEEEKKPVNAQVKKKNQVIISEVNKKDNAVVFSKTAKEVKPDEQKEPVKQNSKSDNVNEVVTNNVNPKLNNAAPPAVVNADTAKLKTDTAALLVKSSGDNTPKKNKKENNDKGKNKSGWEFGLVFTAGMANRVNSLALGGSLKAASNTSGQGFGGGLPAPVTGPGKISSGFLWQAGGYSRKKISNRTAFSAALIFSSYATQQQTGAFVDSTRLFNNGDYSVRANGYYRTGQNLSHKNKYSFFELPLLFEWQINKGKKLPLVWANGLTPGILIASSSLVYNPLTNTYYKDKKAYSRFQLFYSNGLYGRFGQNSKHPVMAGVSFNYSLTGLHKTTSTDKNHLLSFGLQIKYTLKK